MLGYAFISDGLVLTDSACFYKGELFTGLHLKGIHQHSQHLHPILITAKILFFFGFSERIKDILLNDWIRENMAFRHRFFRCHMETRNYSHIKRLLYLLKGAIAAFPEKIFFGFPRRTSICILEGTKGDRWVARVGRRGRRKVSPRFKLKMKKPVKIKLYCKY